MGRVKPVQHWKTGRAGFMRVADAQAGNTHARIQFHDGQKEWRRVAAFVDAPTGSSVDLRLQVAGASTPCEAPGEPVEHFPRAVRRTLLEVGVEVMEADKLVRVEDEDEGKGNM